MRIADCQITPVAVPDPPLLNAAGLHAPYALRLIVELVSADGISGWGEIPGGESTCAALTQAAERIIGADPWQLNAIFAHIDKLAQPDDRGATPWDNRAWVHVRSAIEVACYDLLGKAVGRPCRRSAGRGCARSRALRGLSLLQAGRRWRRIRLRARPVCKLAGKAARAEAALDPAGIVAQAQAMCSHYGFRSIKLKGGVFPPDAEVAAIWALREAFGADVPLRLDPNAIWRVDTAIAAGKKLAGALEYFEDPVRGQANMAAVAREVEIPLATNMCTTSFADLPGSLQHGSEAIILSDHHFWGGLRASLDLARICRSVRARLVYALQQPPGHIAGGDGAAGGRHPQRFVRLRYVTTPGKMGRTCWSSRCNLTVARSR